MKQLSFVEIFIAALLLVILIPQPVMAYIGPGVGLAAIGAFLAIVVGVIAAIFGFAWYPIKRLLLKLKKSKENNENQNSNQEEKEES